MRIATLISQLIDLFYLPILQRFIPKQTFRYAACGAGNMLLDLVLYFLVFHLALHDNNLNLGLVVISPHIAAMFIVFPITFFNGFWLNKYVTFTESKLRTKTQLFRYLLSVIGSILINYVALKIFVEQWGIYPTPSKAITTLISIVYSYLMQKYFSFSTKNN